MNIKELKEKIHELDDQQRQKYFTSLFKKLSPASHEQIFKFQGCWDQKKTFKEFKEKQNEVIIFCIDMELSNIGKALRKTLELDFIDWNTEL